MDDGREPHAAPLAFEDPAKWKAAPGRGQRASPLPGGVFAVRAPEDESGSSRRRGGTLGSSCRAPSARGPSWACWRSCSSCGTSRTPTTELEELEDALIMADFGPATAFKIVDQIREKVESGDLKSVRRCRRGPRLRRSLLTLMCFFFSARELRFGRV